MKKFVKVLALVLALACIATAFAGCGETKSDDTASKSESSIKTVTNGVLTMATNPAFPPYEYYEGDEIVGIDAEIAALIADKLGLKLEIVDVKFASIVPGVQANKYDMGMAGMTVNEDRLKKINFTTSYATGVQVVIVPENSDIKTIDDLKGKKIGVQAGTTGEIYCSGDYGDENLTSYDNGSLAVEGLKSGKVDCVVIDNEPAKAFVAANEGLKILDTEYITEDYAICVSKDNDALLDAIDKALAELIADGKVQEILDKYITAE